MFGKKQPVFWDIQVGALGEISSPHHQTNPNVEDPIGLDEVASLFQLLTNEWVAPNLPQTPLWYHHTGEEPPTDIEDLMAWAYVQVCDQANIPIALLLQGLKTCCDYLKKPEINGYFIEIGSLNTPQIHAPVWYKPNANISRSRSEYSRFVGDLIPLINSEELAKTFTPDLRVIRDFKIPNKISDTPKTCHLVVELYLPQTGKNTASELSRLLTDAVLPMQSSSKLFAAQLTEIKISGPLHTQNKQLNRCSWQVRIPAFNPLFCAIIFRCVLESCHLIKAHLPLKISLFSASSPTTALG